MVVRFANINAQQFIRYLLLGVKGFCLGLEKPEARKMPENAAESRTLGARFVRLRPLNAHVLTTW